MGNRTESGLIRGLKWGRNPLAPVSYTHLPLPTKG